MTRVRRLNPSSLTRRRRIQSGPGPLKRNDNNRSDPNRTSRIVEHQTNVSKETNKTTQITTKNPKSRGIIHLRTIHRLYQTSISKKLTQRITKTRQNCEKNCSAKASPASSHRRRSSHHCKYL